MVPFVKVHDYNFVRKQIDAYQKALVQSSDQKVIQTVKETVAGKILARFANSDTEQTALLNNVLALKKAHDCDKFLENLLPNVITFPVPAKDQIQKLFPKEKKLKYPEVEESDDGFKVFRGWFDGQTDHFYLVYNGTDQKLIGLNCSYERALPNRRYSCFLCNQFYTGNEIILITATCKRRKGDGPDEYRTISNYMCANLKDCNYHITSTATLDDFIFRVKN